MTNTFDDYSSQLIADQVLRLKNQYANLVQEMRTFRYYVSKGGAEGKKDIRGKPTSDIGPGQTGTVEIHDSNGPTGRTFTATNPHSVTLVETEYVRSWEAEDWPNPLISPDEYAICPIPAPASVSDPV